MKIIWHEFIIKTNRDGNNTKISKLLLIIRLWEGEIMAVNIRSSDHSESDAVVFDNALATMDKEHMEVHRGEMYTIGHLFSTVSSGADVFIHLNLGVNSAHLLWKVSTDGDASISINEDATFSADGTEITPVNKNRYSANTSTMEVFYTPTVTDEGSVLESDKITGSVLQAGSPVRSRSEFIFKANTKYLIKVTNDSATTSDILVKIEYYENDD